MKNLTLADFKSLLKYDPDSGSFTWLVSRGGAHPRAIGDEAGTICKGYTTISIFKKKIAAHRLAWFFVNGKWPSSVLDHINRDKTDNRIANLREASVSQNGFNSVSHKDSVSGIKGVSWHAVANKWQVKLRANGKTHYLGLYADKNDASSAYNTAAIKFHGDFAKLNAII